MSLKTFKEILNECNPAESKQQALFEKVYFECNSKLLFEQVLKEAEQKPDIFGVYEDDKLISNGGPSSNKEAYSRYINAPAYGSVNPKISRSDIETDKPFYQKDPEKREKDDQNILYNSVKQFEPEGIENAEDRFNQMVLQQMKISPDFRTRLAYLEETNPGILEQISKDLVNEVRKRIGLNLIK